MVESGRESRVGLQDVYRVWQALRIEGEAPMKPSLIGVALIATVCAACATTSADFRMPTGGTAEAAIAGRLTVIYNGQIFTENCRVTFGEKTLKLSPGGIVMLRVPKGWTSLVQMNCKDTSDQHVRLRGAHLYARGDGWVTDFGDVAVTWHAVGGFKVSGLFGLAGGIVDAATDDGVATIAVKPPVSVVREAFRRQTGGEGRWVVQPLSQPLDVRPAQEPSTPSLELGQRGFFCANSSRFSVCERDLTACEHARAVATDGRLAPCVASDTAWCFATNVRLVCSQTEETCVSRRDRARGAASDLCGEQY
jgi:hypothetical protein